MLSNSSRARPVCFVVVAIIALLIAILIPSLSRARLQARNVLCQANLSEWGKVWVMYLQGNRDSFSTGMIFSPGGWERGEWITRLRSYYYTRSDILRCPLATRRRPDGDRLPVSMSGPLRSPVGSSRRRRG